VTAMAYVVQAIGLTVALYASPLYWKQDYHMSALTGEAWVQELIHGHPERIRSELGMRAHISLMPVAELCILCGLVDSRYVSLQGQVAIFLY
ncbi:hypothetical protein DFH09DRAFT_839396, partial [Mycena vulgaris]